MKLKSRLMIILLLTAFLPFCILFAITYYNLEKSSLIHYTEINTQLVNQIAGTLEVSINEADYAIYKAYANKGTRDYLEQDISEYIEFAEKYRNVGSILSMLTFSNDRKKHLFLVDEMHMRVIESDSFWTNKSIDMDYLSQHWVNKSHENKGILSVILGTEEDDFSFMLSRTVMDIVNDKPLGILAITYDNSFFTDMIDNNTLEDEISIFDSNGTCIFNSIPESLVVNKMVQSTPNKYGWYVKKPISKSFADALFFSTATPIFIVSFVLLMFIISMSLYYSNRISKPIEKLCMSMGKASKGNFSYSMSIIKNSPFNEFKILEEHFNLMLKRLSNYIDHEYKLKLNESQAQLKMIQAKINPHVLFNSLTSIYAEADEYGASSVCAMIKHLSSMLRYTMSNDQYVVTIKDEIYNIMDYLEIQKLHFEENFQYLINVKPELYSLPALKSSLHPIVENSITHGVVHNGSGKICIDISLDGNECVVVISDNGAGVSEAEVNTVNMQLSNGAKETSKHIGLLSVNNRIKLVFPDSHGLSFSSVEGYGSKTTLRWVVKKNESTDS